jgi:molybdenum cofactor guanylyltransferase
MSLFEEPDTCMMNVDGFGEPLVGIWSPKAVQYLKSNLDKGITGPSKPILELARQGHAATG